MADMNSPGSEYLKKYLIEKSMTQAQKARGETSAQRQNRQKQQADRKKNDPKRKAQVADMTSKYDKKTNPQSRADRDLLGTAKDHPDGESAKKLKKRGLDLENKKCAKCGSTENLHMDHVDQHTNGKYSPNGRLQWLCNNCHQPKTAKERKKLGQNENQYGKAKKVTKESFEEKLHGSLRALMEAGEEGNKRERRASKQRAREMEGRRGEEPAGPPPAAKKEPAPRFRQHGSLEVPGWSDQEREEGYIQKHGRLIRKARKPRKVGGRTILPKYKEQSGVFLHFRRHPKYKDVLQVVDVDIDREHAPTIRASAREVYNELYRRINNVEYHRTYKLSQESLSKYGLTDSVISGKELGVEEDAVHVFELKVPGNAETTLISRSYTTDMVFYTYQDYHDNKVRQGHIIKIDDDPDSDGKIITFRDITGETTQIVTNEKLETDTSGQSHYRYGRPGRKPDLVNPYWWSVSTDESGKQKKQKKYVYNRNQMQFDFASDDSIYSGSPRAGVEELFDAIEKLAPTIAAEEMRSQFWRDAYQQVSDEWEKSGQAEKLTPEKHNQLARSAYQAIVTSNEGKRQIDVRAKEIVEAPSDAVKARARQYLKEQNRPQLMPRDIPRGMANKLREDPRLTADIFEVTREADYDAAASDRDVAHSHQWSGKRWESSTGPAGEDKFNNPADLNKLVYTLYGVEVVSPDPDHDFLRYIINGYRPEADYMSNYSAVVPQMMLAARPREENRSVVHLQVKNASPQIDDEGQEVDPYRTLKIDWQDIEARTDTGQDSYFREIAKIRADYQREIQALLDAEKDPEKEEAMRNAMEKALAETARKDTLEKRLDAQTDEEEELQGQETDEVYMERTGLRKMAINERALADFNFYGEKEIGGKVVWPALEASEIRYDVRNGVTKGIRYAIPKTVKIYDTYDMMGNLHPGIMSQQTGEEYGWLDLATHSENYDSFGMMKPASQRIGRVETSSAGMKFRPSMSSAEFAVEMINPYLMKLDPNKQLAYAERVFRNAWNDPDRRDRMRARAIETLATQRALDEVGDPSAWYNLSDTERQQKQLLAKRALLAELQEKNEDTEELVRSQAQDTFRLQSLTSLNRSMSNMKGQCPKCQGQCYLKLTLPMELRGNVNRATTKAAIRDAFDSGEITYEKATSYDYEQAKKDDSGIRSVIICNACGGTGQQLKETATTLYAGQQSKRLDRDVFMKALSGALSFGEKDNKLIANTVDALFPDRLTELTRTSVPAAQIRPFLKILASITDQYLGGKMDVEGALVPERFSRPTKKGEADFVRFKVPTAEGDRSFIAPADSKTRYVTLQALVDAYGDLDSVKDAFYIEGKEDPESYLLDSITAAAYGGYGELQQASMPAELEDYRKIAAANFETLSPAARAKFLQGNPAGKQEFEKMIEQLAADQEARPDVNSMRDAIRPWVTKTILQVVSVQYQTGLTSIDKLAQELKSIDRTEDVQINRDNSFYVIAAEAYRRAIQEINISKEDFVNDPNICSKYVGYVLIGDTAPVLEDEVEEKGVVVVGCKDVSNGQDVILRYNLERDKDQRVLRVWDESSQMKAPPKISPDVQKKITQDKLADALHRFDVKNRTPIVKYLTKKAGMKPTTAHSIVGNLAAGKINQAASAIAGHLSKQKDPEVARSMIINTLGRMQYPAPMLKKLQTLLEKREMTESRTMPILMIAEEIDSGAGTRGYTPEDIAGLID